MKYREGCTEEFDFQYFNVQKNQKQNKKKSQKKPKNQTHQKNKLLCKIYIGIMPNYVYID